MAPQDRITIRVSVYSDYTCPWCYVGSARLKVLSERLLAESNGSIQLAETWMPFEIHPDVPADGMPVDELPYSEERFREMSAYLSEQARAEGLPMVERKRLANTHRALAAGTFVQDRHPEHFSGMHEGLFQAYFGQGEDLNEVDVLRRIATESGIDGDELEHVLEAGEYDDAIAATGEMARRLGISATPTFVFENEFAVVGAHPVETLHEAAMEVVEKLRS